MSTNPSPFGGGGGQQPWQFPVSAYGAKGNGKIINDAAMTTGQNLLNSPTANFTTADIGKNVLVSCAGGGTYSPLGQVTITAVNSPTQAVLSANATSTTPGNSYAAYATDDTAAIRAALAAATTYAQAGPGYAEIVFSNAIYGVAGPAQIPGGVGSGNAQIPLPISPTNKQKIILVFCALTRGYDQALMHWLQTTPQAAGAALVCLRSDGTLDASNGGASMIGGPFNGYGGNLGLYSNCMPVVDGVQMIIPYNSTYGGWDFYGMAEAQVESGSCMAMATVPAAPPYPNITNPNNISNTWTFGVRMPSTGNNDRSDVKYWSSEGPCYGIMPSEHCSVLSTRNIYNVIGVEGYSGNGVAMPHAARIKYASVEGCAQSLGFFDGIVNLDIDTFDTESGANIIYDPTNKGVGSVHIRDAAGYFSGGIVNSAQGIRPILVDQRSGPVNAPQAPPATGVAWVNGYYRDAWITLTATTISAVTITGMSGGVAKAQAISGTPTTYTFLLPSGNSYTPTYTGTLTHTVTLL